MSIGDSSPLGILMQYHTNLFIFRSDIPVRPPYGGGRNSFSELYRSQTFPPAAFYT